MRKSAKRKIYLLIFIFASAFFVVKSIKSKQSETKEVAEEQPKMEEVMIAVRDLNPGTVIQDSDIIWQDEESKTLPRGSVKKSMEGRVLGNMRVSSPIYEGEIVQMKFLRNSTASWDNVTPGMAVHAFKFDANKGIGAILRPNMLVRVVYIENDKIVVVIDHARVISIKSHTIAYSIRSKKSKNASKDSADNKDNENEEEVQEEKDKSFGATEDDVLVEVTPQMAQMLSIDHGGRYVLIPIKYHPGIHTPSSPYAVGDMGRTFMPINTDGNRVIRTIKGSEISFQNLHSGVVTREELGAKPVDPNYAGVRKYHGQRAPVKPRPGPVKPRPGPVKPRPGPVKPPYRLKSNVSGKNMPKVNKSKNDIKQPPLIFKKQLKEIE